MSYAGHVQDMINRMRQNRSLTASQKKKNRTLNSGPEIIKTGRSLKFEEVSPSQLNAVKEGIHRDIEEKKKYNRIVMAVGVVLGIVFVLYLYSLLPKQ